MWSSRSAGEASPSAANALRHPDPGSVQILSDYAWLSFVGAWPTAILQSLAIGICILAGEGTQAVYPRWVGYLNLWMSGLYAPGLLGPSFTAGRSPGTVPSLSGPLRRLTSDTSW